MKGSNDFNNNNKKNKNTGISGPREGGEDISGRLSTSPNPSVSPKAPGQHPSVEIGGMSALSWWTAPRVSELFPWPGWEFPQRSHFTSQKTQKGPTDDPGLPDSTSVPGRLEPGLGRPGHDLRVPGRGRSNELGSLAPSLGPAAPRGGPWARGLRSRRRASGRKLTGWSARGVCALIYCARRQGRGKEQGPWRVQPRALRAGGPG